jgi:hypothetical protein
VCVPGALAVVACGILGWAWRERLAREPARAPEDPVAATRADLGELPCGSYVDVVIPLTNQTDRPLYVLDVPSVCGLNACIRATPGGEGRWLLPAGATADYPCQIYVREPGEEFLVVTRGFLDDGGALCQFRIELVGRGRPGGSHAAKHE